MEVLNHESTIRLAGFGGVLLLMLLWELLAPRRRLTVSRPLRWSGNLGLVVTGTVVVRLLIPIGAVSMALIAAEHRWGILNNVSLPEWSKVLIAFVALDLVIYLQHVMFHAVPALWRLHMVHHADLDFDTTTGVRFHPIEILLSMGIKFGAIVLLGAPAVAVLAFEVILNATSLFNHGNVRIPGWLDRVLRLFVVTPDMHRVHHSVHPRETNSNFGFNLPWWDYLMGTYRAQPAEGHEHMTVGLDHLRDTTLVERLDMLLALPFIGTEGDYPVNRAGGEALPPVTAAPTFSAAPSSAPAASRR
jgi:sterol desaturase/sphingolipid hydroxylase (fatty acid hydroxylase superfamily)